MRPFVMSKVIAGHAVDLTSLIDIMIIVGLTATMLLHVAIAPSMA